MEWNNIEGLLQDELQSPTKPKSKGGTFESPGFWSNLSSSQLKLDSEDHAPIMTVIEVDLNDLICQQAKKVLNKKGDFIPTKKNASFTGLKSFGPYQYKSGVYLGQFYLGKAHGLGTFVR